MTTTEQREPTSPPAPDGRPDGLLRVSLIGLTLCIVLAVVVLAFGWVQLHDTDWEDSLGWLMLLAAITVTGGLFGLMALVSSLSHYGHGRSPVRALGVVVLAVGVLVGGGYLILTATQPMDAGYERELAWRQASERAADEWKAREVYPSCGTVVVTVRLAPSEFGPAEFRCMRRANAAGRVAELVIERKPQRAVWYVRTNPDRTVDVYIHHLGFAGDVPDSDIWHHSRCSVEQVRLVDATAVCRGVRYLDW